MIELTEHTALHDRVTTGQILQRLKRLGVQIALDDFGSGYASLSHLRQLPVDVLKLDRAFAAGIGREPRDESVMQALLKLGHGLDLTVVVEGIEYPEQLSWLHKVGCPLVQGYLIGRPCTPDMIGL
jgi:EAL domain-containing protein (putative c-di-GMP-specific phosphodiesterase class I)